MKILLVILAVIATYLYANKWKPKDKTTHATQVEETPPTNTNQINEIKSYSTAYKREYLLTINEKNQYWQLRKWADSKNLIVFTKVRLADLISPRSNRTDSKSLFWKIQAKHVDFVICDQRINVVCIVELQDNSHNRNDRIERDKFVREVLESCGYIVIQTFGITADLLDKACGYSKQEIEIRHDPTDQGE